MSSAVNLLRGAKDMLAMGLEVLLPEEEYLREELEAQLHGAETLLEKVRVEQVLIRDRDALLSDPSTGLGEHLDGV
jgi:hypothetical protein